VTPLILDALIRVDSIPLALACLALALIVLALLAYIPITRRRAYNRGAAAAEPKLQRDLTVSDSRLESARAALRELRVKNVDLLEVNAKLRGHAADLARKAMEMVNAHEDPTEAQAHILRMSQR
jgi:signal transduction histidine kinase